MRPPRLPLPLLAAAAGALALTGCARTAAERGDAVETCIERAGLSALALDYRLEPKTIVEVTRERGADDEIARVYLFEDAEAARLEFDYEEDRDRPLTRRGPVVLEAPMDLRERPALERCAADAAKD